MGAEKGGGGGGGRFYNFFKNCETADLATFTKEIPNRKLHFLCSVICSAGDHRAKYFMAQ